jgi:uncharacterized metal-binding protein YceD (DUF177 family)
LQFTLTPGADWVRSAATEALDAAPTLVQGELEVMPGTGRRVNAEGRIHAMAPATCDRCGETCDRVVDAHFELVYLPHSDELAAELELGADDLDIGWYRDGTLDLADVVREAIALSLAPRTTCSDTVGCDARTAALLGDGASDGGTSAFAALRALH